LINIDLLFTNPSGINFWCRRHLDLAVDR
jgi:hypothetical protein